MTKPGELAKHFQTRLVGSGSRNKLASNSPKTWYENYVPILELEGQRATLTFEKAILGDSGEPDLEKIYKHRLVLPYGGEYGITSSHLSVKIITKSPAGPQSFQWQG